MLAAFSMTIDPDGAMHDWVDLPEGWSLARVPTQELIHLVGPHVYQQALIDLCRRQRPEILVTHPPYDWLDPPTAACIRDAGTRLVGYAFDDEIFASQYGMNVRSEIAQIYDKYVTTREVRWATRPLPPLPEQQREFDVVLVGRAYQRRRDLVQALRDAGIRVETRGLGWPESFVSRAQMLDLYARAAIVLTTADWESRAVPMVKHRLLDTAMLGAFQIAQEAPDLRGYFDENQVPSFANSDELIGKVKLLLQEDCRPMARAARQRALREHTWTHRFPELIAGLELQKRNERSFRDDRERQGEGGVFASLVTALASRAEAEGRMGAAEALWREVGDDAGLGRCLRDLGRHAEAVEHLRRAATATGPTCAGSIYASLPSHASGSGLGRLGLLPPAAEPTMLWVASLVELDRIDEAAQVLDSLDGALARAVKATLSFGDRAELEPLRQALARLK
jgi:hypothetical protein